MWHLIRNHLISSFQTEKKPETVSPASLCICRRQRQKILCRSCGHVFDGRVRKKCFLHPNEIHLMDQPCCPLCKTTYLQEIGGLTPSADGEANDTNNNASVTPIGDIDNNNIPEETSRNADHILLQQLSKKIKVSSSENWEEDLTSPLENLR